MWIQGQNKQGLLIIAALSQQFTWYVGSVINTLGYRDRWAVYDPDVLALAASGVLGQDQIDPTNSWYQDLPDRFNDPTVALEGGPNRAGNGTIAAGVTFDALTNTLYVLSLNSWDAMVSGGLRPSVHAYSVNT